MHKASSVIPDLEQDKHACIYILNYQKAPKYVRVSPSKHRQFTVATDLFHKLLVLNVRVIHIAVL